MVAQKKGFKKMRKIFVRLFILSFVYLALQPAAQAGQVTWPPEYRTKITTKIYKLAYDKVFDSALEYCAAGGFSVLVQNRQGGVILTDYQNSSDYAAGRGRIRLSFNLSKTPDNATRVMISANCEDTYHRGTRAADNWIDEGYYQDVFSAFEKVLNKSDAPGPQGQTSSDSGGGILRF